MTMLGHSRPLFCRVIGLHATTADIRIVRLAIVSGGPFRFAAGQYARVTFLAQSPRDYSLANSPLEPVLEFHVRHRADGGTGHFVARTLRIGDHVWVEGPFGEAWLRPNHSGPILCIAGGSGLGPMKSIVETALAARPDRRVDLYFGGRNERDIYLEDHFQALAHRHPNFRYHVLLSATRPTTTRRRGTVVDGVVADFAAPLAGRSSAVEGAKVYMAGPPAMVEAAVIALQGLGVPLEDIHADPVHAVAGTEPAASV
ncbi:MAG: FAD-binding oxidoreductase [Rhodospirillales bacterium]